MDSIQNEGYKNFCNMIINNKNVLEDETGQFLLWMGIYLNNINVVKYAFDNYNNVDVSKELSNKIYTTFLMLGINLLSDTNKNNLDETQNYNNQIA
tara:strand:+ start:1563 stop:1850 length:288 start_codon:yes stop_codon:yes gene_type:complete